MNNYIKVSVPKMKDRGERIQSNIEKIPQFVQELESAMKSLGSCWEGAAWNAFQMQVRSDILNMLEMYDWLQKYLQATSEGEKNYGNCEKKSYDCIGKVRI